MCYNFMHFYHCTDFQKNVNKDVTIANICLIYIITIAINMNRGINYIFYQYSYILVLIKEERSNSRVASEPHTAPELKEIETIFRPVKANWKKLS